MISIITVTLNAEKTLEETLLSIVRQTYQDFEIVAIDGGSTDSTIKIFKKYNAYIGTLISEHDSGIYNAMNKGVRAAKGEILFFLNAQDTLYSPNVFAKVVDAFYSNNKPLIVFGDVYFSNKTHIPHALLLQLPDIVKSYKNAGYEDPAICHQAIFYHRHLFTSVGLYDEKYKIYADYDFNIRAFYYAQNRYSYIPEIISNFDLGGVSTIINPKYQKIQAEENSVLRIKKDQMWAHSAQKNFLFSKAFSALNGYYIQLFGFRIDWTEFMKYFGFGKVDLPISLDFATELPPNFRISGFLPLEGWGRWINAARGTVSFPLNKKNIREYIVVKMRLYLFMLQKLTLTILLNGRKVGNKSFSEQTTEKSTDVEVEFIIPSDYFNQRKNTFVFNVDGYSNPKEAGVNGDDRFLGIGLQTLRLENYFERPLKYDHWYDFAQPLTLPFKTSGFYSPEAWGAWLKKNAVIELFLGAVEKNDLKLVILYRIFLPDTETLHFSIYMNDEKVKSLDFTKDSSPKGSLSFTFSSKMFMRNTTPIQIRFLLENPIDLHERFHVDDYRLLGVGFERVCLLTKGNDIPEIMKTQEIEVT